jgi:hypothetical protein
MLLTIPFDDKHADPAGEKGGNQQTSASDGRNGRQ